MTMSTSTERFDVVIVGARCAGATLATVLARAGLRVAVVDKSALPSDLVLSTHTVHPSGMAVMDELGLGDAVRARSPEMRVMRLDWHGGVLDLEFSAGRGEYCPRRERFDGLLQDAAREAGARIEERTRALGLVHRRDRVCGVEVAGPDGVRRTLAARLVVGADGRNSRVASWVGAEEYLGYDAPRGMYWGYFPAPRGWGRSAEYPCGMYVSRRGATVRVAFHTDGDQLLLGTLPLRHELERFRADPLGALRGVLCEDPMLRAAAAQDPVEPVRGFLGERYFLRRATGPGWMLLGDAGLHKDFLSGDGMSEALLQARAAARVVVDALGLAEPAAERAFERFWRQRDVDALPLYFHARDLAEPASPGGLDRAVFRGIARRPALAQRFAGIFAREISPYEVVPALTALRFSVSAALGGEPRVLAEFLARGRRTQAVMRELDYRRRLLAACDVAGAKPRAPLGALSAAPGGRLEARPCPVMHSGGADQSR